MVTYTVLISVDPTDVQLLPGMTATVTIVTQSADNAVLVPNAAISNGNVRVLRNGNPVTRAGPDGHQRRRRYADRLGAAAGDQVVTGSPPQLKSARLDGAGRRNIFGFGAPGR